MKRADDNGFTLLELLVTVLIIGILVAIAIPVYLTYRHSAYKQAMNVDALHAGTVFMASQSVDLVGGYVGRTITGEAPMELPGGKLVASPTNAVAGFATPTEVCVEVTSSSVPNYVVSWSSVTNRIANSPCTIPADYVTSADIDGDGSIDNSNPERVCNHKITGPSWKRKCHDPAGNWYIVKGKP